MIRIAASIQPGDSGGALLNNDGKVIGMNTAADTGGGSFGFQSGTTGFAIPIENALAIADQIKDGDESNGVHIGGRAMLGVRAGGPGATSRLRRHDAAAPTVTGTSATTRRPADVGIGEGDTITALGGRTIRSGDELRAALDRYHPGEKVRVTWIDSSGDDPPGDRHPHRGPARRRSPGTMLASVLLRSRDSWKPVPDAVDGS